ncbi:MAG TPA: hypothetical protein DCE23_10115 [Firmicutes bacterium]|nr:hypothetical protein [Bacillota bacterium]
MIRRLTKRYIVSSLESLNLSSPLRYERYYINDNLRIQKKNEILEKEELDDSNEVLQKVKINEEEFNTLKDKAYKKIIRDSYLYLDDDRISIKSYYDDYEGLNRVEVKFNSEEEMNNFVPYSWMKEEITNTSLAFDKDLSKLSKEEFLKILRVYVK